MNYDETLTLYPRVELWQQLGDSDLWETESDLIVNTAALEERSAYFEVIRIPSAQSAPADLTLLSA